MKDPFLYPGTKTLINLFNIKDPEKLQELESAYYHVRLNQLCPLGKFDYDHLKDVHYHLFGDVYPWAGQERTIDIAKNNSYFAHVKFLTREMNKTFSKLQGEYYLQGLEKNEFCIRLAHYFNEINAAHPFREGNGRTLRLFTESLANQAGYKLRWIDVGKKEYLAASIAGFEKGDALLIALLQKIID